MKTAVLVFALVVASACVEAAGGTIVLRVPELAGADRDEMVTSGVPLAKGVLPDPAQCRLLDSKAAEVPFAGTVLARWPDGSVKWLLLDFRAKVAARKCAQFWLECGVASTAKLPNDQISTVEGEQGIEVTTGPLRFRVRRDKYTFLDAVWLDVDGNRKYRQDESVVSPGRGDSRLEVETTPPGPPEEENWLRNAAGGTRRQYTAVVTKACVEFENAMRAVVLVRGEYRDADGRGIGPFWTRYTAWAGSAAIGVEHFFAFDADVEKAFLRTLSLGLQLAGERALTAEYGLGEGDRFAPDPNLRESALVEVMPDRFYNCVPLSVDRRVKYQVVGVADEERPADKLLKEGVEASGWVSVQSDTATTTVALRDFPRLHPKEIRVEQAGRSLRYYLWPERGGKVLDLRRRYKGQRVEDHYDTGEYEPAGRGFGKTHQMLIEFRPGRIAPDAADALARRANEPLRAFCTPEYYGTCGVWSPFHPADPARFPKTEALIRIGIEWALRLPGLFHWDGIVDWGDTLFQGYEAAGHKQIKDVPKTSWVVRGYDGWFNNDCNVSHDFLLFFLRSGDDRIFQYAERMIQHIMDVDTIHAAQNRTEVGGGRRHDEQHWGSTYTGYGTAAVEAGDLYYLTGSLWAKEMLARYADWYMVGGGSEWETRLPCLVLAWEATGDKRYMDFIKSPAIRNDVFGLKMGERGAIDQPHWRTVGVELGVDLLYRATGDAQWRDHLVTAARRFIEAEPGNGYGRSLLARAYLETGDKEILDWMRRLMAVAEPYARTARIAFFKTTKVPDDLSALSWEELNDLARKAGMADVRALIYTFRYYPYVMAALAKAGMDEGQMELVDFALDRRGMGQYHLRGPDVPEPKEAHHEPVSIAAAANCDPLDDPFGLYGKWKRYPLGPGEIGFDFGEWGEFEPGYLPVRPATRYPYRAAAPPAAEHDCVNLVGLPFGTTFYANNVPFALPDPGASPGGRTMLVVGKGERVSIAVHKTARRLYVLGHVCRALSSWKTVGARYQLTYEDGSKRTIELTNLEDYENVFQWGFAGRALFARNWKAQGAWDGGAPILHNYAIELEPKPLKELGIEDTGNGIGFMIVAVTAEVAGGVAEKPVLDVSFGPAGAGAARQMWKEGGGAGWVNVSGSLTQSTGVMSDGAATFRMVLPDGLYEAEMELSGSSWSSPFDVRVNDRLAVRGFVATSGCIPGVTSRPDRIRFPVRVQGGRLDLTLEADRTFGSWRHPVRLRGTAWHVTRLRVFPGKEEPAPARPEMKYGWVGGEVSVVDLPADVAKLKDARLQSCIRSKSPSAIFCADLPAGDYEAELMFAVRGDGRREGPVKMNVTVQGKRVLSDFDGGSFEKPVVRAFPVRVEAGGNLEIDFEVAGEGNEWGINAITVRARKP